MRFRILNFKVKIFETCFFVIFFAIGSFFFAPNRVEALTISPLRQSVVVDPGGGETLVISVTNDSASEIQISGQVDAFGLDKETGRPIFGVEDESLDWVRARNRNISLQSGEKSNLLFDVDVPEQAEPGAHYLALFALREASPGTVGVSSRVGSLLFLHVAGEVKEELTKEEFLLTKKVYTRPPIDLSLVLQNSGSIHVVPQGEVVIQKKSGKVVARKQVNLDNRKVLPGETWSTHFSFVDLQSNSPGKLEAKVYLQYGTTEQQLVVSQYFWHIPFWFVVGVPLLVVFGLVIFMRSKKMFGAHKHIE